MAADNKKKANLAIRRQNVLESLKDLGGGIFDQAGDLVTDTSQDFLRELLGLTRKNIKRSGEINAGESIEMNQVLSGEEEENQKLKSKLYLERKLAEEEKIVSQEKTNQLRVELQALTMEVAKVSRSVNTLVEETKVATFQAPAEPGIYHIVFFQKLLEFLQSFRKKIDDAATWLEFSNRRAQKKNFWAIYKKKGSSFLLSPDHYSQRSAG
jgi:hypothetical protein